MEIDYPAILESLSNAAVVVDATNSIHYANPSALKLFGWKRELSRGANIMQHLQPGSSASTFSHLRDALSGNGSIEVPGDVLARSDGELVHLGYRTFPLSGAFEGRLVVFTNADATAGHGSEDYFRLLFTKSPVPMWVYDAGSFKFLDVNDAALAMYGYSKEEFLSMLLTDLYPQSEIQSLLPLLAGATEDAQLSREGRHQGKGGQIIDVEVQTHIMDFRGQKAILMQSQNITERKRTAEQLEYRALHDSLTDLPNRALFRDRLGQAVRAAHRSRLNLAVLFLDLNQFKQVNDVHGHQFGDLLLQEVARRLRSVMRDSDTVARFAGDEFSVLLPGTIESGAIRASRKIVDAMSVPFSLNGVEIESSASIGIAVYPVHGEDAEALMGQADHAMYEAKRSGSGYAVSRLRSAPEIGQIAGKIR